MLPSRYCLLSHHHALEMFNRLQNALGTKTPEPRAFDSKITVSMKNTLNSLQQ